VGLAYRAIRSLHEAEMSRPGWIVLATACLSILAKELVYRWTAKVGRRVRSSALIANAWHHRSDALSSVPVAIAVLGTKIWPAWGFLDQIATVIVSVLILHAAWSITWPALRELVDAGATRLERKAMFALAAQTEGVAAVHKLRTRSIGPGLQVDLHVQVEPELSVRRGHEIAGMVKARLLDEGPNVIDVLVHLEPFEGDPRPEPVDPS
jgi:cation diffusion facilitator family transporter